MVLSCACGGASQPPASTTDGTGLVFTPEAGSAADGTTYLYYEDSLQMGQRRALSSNGLTFSRGLPIGDDRSFDPRRVLLPDNTWRLYQLPPDGQEDEQLVARRRPVHA